MSKPPGSRSIRGIMAAGTRLENKVAGSLDGPKIRGSLTDQWEV